MTHIPRHKIVVCGTTNAGKSSLIGQYVDGVFTPARFPTTLPLAHSVRLTDAQGPYELSIWDTAGVDEWISRNSSIYHSAQIVIFVASYDIAESLSDIFEKWIPILQNHIELENCVKLLAINKSDILAEQEEVHLTGKEIEQAKEQLGAELFCVSAKDGTNVAELFAFAANAVRANDLQAKSTDGQPKQHHGAPLCRC
jgi:small GTP-binding protein